MLREEVTQPRVVSQAHRGRVGLGGRRRPHAEVHIAHVDAAEIDGPRNKLWHHRQPRVRGERQFGAMCAAAELVSMLEHEPVLVVVRLDEGDVRVRVSEDEMRRTSGRYRAVGVDHEATAFAGDGCFFRVVRVADDVQFVSILELPVADVEDPAVVRASDESVAAHVHHHLHGAVLV